MPVKEKWLYTGGLYIQAPNQGPRGYILERVHSSHWDTFGGAAPLRYSRCRSGSTLREEWPGSCRRPLKWALKLYLIVALQTKINKWLRPPPSFLSRRHSENTRIIRAVTSRIISSNIFRGQISLLEWKKWPKWRSKLYYKTLRT